MNPTFRLVTRGLLGTAVGLVAGYAYAFMRYGEQGLWVSQFALFLASGALGGLIVGAHTAKKDVSGQWLRLSAYLIAVLTLMETVNQWIY